VWADPEFILSSNDRQYNDVVLVGNTVGRLARNNPKRWAIGFLEAVAGAGDASVGPWSDVGVYSLVMGVTRPLVWFTMFDYGTIIQGEWFGLSAIGTTIRVIELEIG
jgi:hypothetical protein